MTVKQIESIWHLNSIREFVIKERERQSNCYNYECDISKCELRLQIKYKFSNSPYN